jgi:hypothetical protein
LNRTIATLPDVLIEAERAGVPRKAIAAAAGVSERLVGYWISGDKSPSLETARLMMQRGPRELQDLLSTYWHSGTDYRSVRGPIVDPAC